MAAMDLSKVGRGGVAGTLIRMDADGEPPWTDSRRFPPTHPAPPTQQPCRLLLLTLPLLWPRQVPGAARQHTTYRGCLIGSTIRKVDPTPGVLSRSIRPLCLLMML